MRLIGLNGEQIGVVSSQEALRQAEDVGVDLVEISPNVDPPVCRIMVYGKYLFEQKKKTKQKTKSQQLKELKMRPTTDIGDYQVRIKRAIGFLEDGDKVKFSIKFRGREMAYADQGRDLLARVIRDLEEYGTPEQPDPRMEGRSMVVLIVPGKTAK